MTYPKATPTKQLAGMLHRRADLTKSAKVQWACYTLLNDLVHCDEDTNVACGGDDFIPLNATLKDLVEIRFGYLADNTRDLFDGSGDYAGTQQEVNSLLAYRILT